MAFRLTLSQVPPARILGPLRFTPALNCTPGTVTVLRGMNNGGQIVGGCVDAQTERTPFAIRGRFSPSYSYSRRNDRQQKAGRHGHRPAGIQYVNQLTLAWWLHPSRVLYE